MRLPIPLLIALTLAAGASFSFGQGLLAIERSANFADDQPLTWSVGVNGGYDSLQYQQESEFFPDIESFFLQGAVGTTYTKADRVTPWSIDLDAGTIYYLDDLPRQDDIFYNARAAFNIAHELSQRLRLSNNFFVTYEVEPNLGAGATTTLRNGQYFYGYNNFNLSYAWSRRVTTTTSYTIDSILYQDDFVSESEDRLSNLIAQQFSYQLKPQTALVGEYRFQTVDYLNRDDVDFTSHYVLAGVDHAWSRRFSGSVRGGAQFFSSDRTEEVAPYAETALDYQLDRQTSVRWFTSLGFDGAEVQNFDSRYSLRTGVNALHQFDRRLSANGSLSYVYSEFDGGEQTESVTENSILMSAGLNYLLWETLSLNAQYSYTLLESNDPLREFDRNRVSLGMSATF